MAQLIIHLAELVIPTAEACLAEFVIDVKVVTGTGKIFARFVIHIPSLEVQGIVRFPHKASSCSVNRHLLELIRLSEFVRHVTPLVLLRLELYIERVSHSVAHGVHRT